MEFINFEPFSFGGETGRRAGFKIQFPRKCGFDSHPRYTPGQILFLRFVPFFVVTSLFILWGFANSVTDPMEQAFKKIHTNLIKQYR